MPFGQPISDIVWAEAAAYIGISSANELLSIKIRPLDDIDTGMPQFYYVDYGDYDTIMEYLRQFKEVRQGPFGDGGGTAFVYELPDGTRFVFGQHETGPEFVIFFDLVNYALKSLAEDAGSIAIILAAVNRVVRLVREISAKKYRNLTGAPDKSTISIETRTTGGARVVRTLKLDSEKGEETVSMRDLLNREH
jgi:hypothetical protein